MTTPQAKALAKSTLSKKRYQHTKNVAAAAVALANHYGADAERAALAAWLHDIVKEQPPAALLQMVGEDAIMAKSLSARPQAVWHGPCAAVYAQRKLGLEDGEILDALACHTTGRVNMTQLDKILFLADAISREREYPGVETVRRAAWQDLDLGVATMLRHSIAYERQRGRPLDPESEAALTWLLQQRPDLARSLEPI